ncbi:hypothetical protein BACIT_3247 [Bacillus amyloliquefaciens]|nr:hypothetical protein BACIT_3247 [Bacillus amyloliquefaciens]
MSPFIKNDSLHQMMHITRFPLVLFKSGCSRFSSNGKC